MNRIINENLEQLKRIEIDLLSIYQLLTEKEELAQKISENVHFENKLSAMNLIRYINIRSNDLRKIHDNLSELGISSIRSCEGYVWSNVTSALKLVKLLKGEIWNPIENSNSIGFKKSKMIMRHHTKLLFENEMNDFRTKIMVTMPSEASEDRKLIKELLGKGMSIARINLSHDKIATWTKMVKNINNEKKRQKKSCLIYMDLSGPKIRTNSINILKKGKKKSNAKHFVLLKKGDHLILNQDAEYAKSTKKNKKGEVIRYATIGVSLPSILEDVGIGDRILFDDGKISSKVINKSNGNVEVVINIASKKGIKLKGEKGINLPDTKLNLPSLTPEDIKNLPFIVKNADLVGYSFVRTPQDVKVLYENLEKLDRKDIGIILKIENREAFENLPLILIEAMKFPKLGVMIARGDLAVEIGPERIAEVQDEILWICEAAHIPVIWATQVLETLAKTGSVTRAEITDAAKSSRAECVMLNKGPYIVDAVKMLSQILAKMKKHTSKKRNILRPLDVARKNMMLLEKKISTEDEYDNLKTIQIQTEI